MKTAGCLMKNIFITFSLVFNLLLAFNTSATKLLPINLEQLSTRASLIFYATVINNTAQKDSQSGQIVTFTEFEIIELIKGSANSIHTIKQLGGQLKESNIKFQIDGVPKYQIGNQYVVFLPQKSSLGFSSPLGLHQGSFSVANIDGENIITNGRNIAALQASNKQTQLSLSALSNKPAHASLSDFINTIHAHNKK